MEKKKGGFKGFVITLAVILFSVIFFIIKVFINSTPAEDFPSFTPIFIGVVFVIFTGYAIYVIFFSKDSFYRKKRLEKKAQDEIDHKTIAQVKTFEQKKKKKSVSESKRTNWVAISLVIFAFIGLLLGAFYWFEYRPTQIKKNCSYVKVTIPEVQAVTAEESANSKMANQQCRQKINIKVEEDQDGIFNTSGLEKWFAEEECNNKYAIKEETTYQPSREEYRNATDKEYENCLRGKGL